jgi:uncharacterized protein YkwD
MLLTRLLSVLIVASFAASATATEIAPPNPQETAAQLNAARFEKILAQLDPEEAEVIRQTNAIRRQHGLRALWPEIKLSMAARDHSHDMRILGFFDHWSPVEGKGSHMDRARRYGSDATSENILYGAGGASSAVDMWMNSDGHRANILTGGWTRIGVGRSGSHYTQLFGG